MDEPPYKLSNAEWSPLKSYTHKQQKQTQQVVFIFIYMCIHMCRMIIKEKDYQLEGFEEG